MSNARLCWSVALLALLLVSCQKSPTNFETGAVKKQAEQQPFAEGIRLTVDKVLYSATDTIHVRLQNDGADPIFLEGCSQLFLAAKVDTGWIESPLWVCAWEGFAVEIAADSSYGLTWPAEYLRAGRYRFVAPVYFGCTSGQPISGAQCTRREVVYSQDFYVAAQAAGHLSIATHQNAYSWSSADFEASRLLEATLTNDSHTMFYAKLGDGFISSLDQEDLFVAQGTDGEVEQEQTDGAWHGTPRALLIEGTRVIVLRPRQSYRLLVPLQQWQGDESGRFRIKVEYFDRIDPSPGVLPMVDYSNVFEISR